MFERRLKIFLGVLALFAFALLVRAGQVQIAQHDQWSQAAADSMRRTKLVETVRGNVRDRNGKLLAVDQPCVDVCVDYRAITEPPDEKWVLYKGEQRAKAKTAADEWDKLGRAKRKELAAAEVAGVRQDLRGMWDDLARMGLRTPEQVDDVRQGIVKKVEMRKRIAWYRSYQRAMRQQEDRQQEAFWRRWLVEGVSTDKSDAEKYAVTVEEESQSHVILRAADVAVQNHLGKYADRYPGLELKASTHRTYPYGSTASHLMGRVTRVTYEDIKDPTAPTEETRQYLPNDEIGRGGVEQLCERALRGTKGKVERVPGQAAEASRVDPLPGQDVRLTIDVELQQKVEAAFARVELYGRKGEVDVAEGLHGGAVVIDVATGEALALASAPTFDLNTFEEFYPRLAADAVNSPLLNRATMAQLQPGSTMKPFVGLGAITQGVVTADTGIECTGYMMKPNGKRWPWGRCWVASKYEGNKDVPSVAHHPIPVPHPTGFLTYPDALERSCNVYFETLAEKLGLEGLSDWDERFGLGRTTGIGLAEARGRLPRSYNGPAGAIRQKTWFSGIGQDPVAATPIQMANAVATIARNGVWMRPRLLSPDEQARLGVTLPVLKAAPRGDADVADDDAGDGKPDVGKAALPTVWPDAYDLNLNPTALAAAREGMQRVVYGSAGTGDAVVRHAPALQGLRICGKTGTAQAPKFGVVERDPKTGKPILDDKGKPKFRLLEPSLPGKINPEAPWYRGGGLEGRELNHAWYIAFAPADHPKVALAVMVEYGGSGGGAAAAVAREILTACVDRGYLVGNGGPKAGKAAGATVGPQAAAELLHTAADAAATR
jgi:penicillin-binding protein 2